MKFTINLPNCSMLGHLAFLYRLNLIFFLEILLILIIKRHLAYELYFIKVNIKPGSKFLSSEYVIYHGTIAGAER